MAVKHWSLDDIEWSRFDATKVSPDLIAVIKTAAMVERNGADYGRYLDGVFCDDPAFRAAANRSPVKSCCTIGSPPERVTPPPDSW